MSLDSLEQLFLEELKDVYNAEKQILRALPKMAKTAESPELQQAFTKHLKETEGQVQRLERIFRELGQAARGKKCKGMEGLFDATAEYFVGTMRGVLKLHDIHVLAEALAQEFDRIGRRTVGVRGVDPDDTGDATGGEAEQEQIAKEQPQQDINGRAPLQREIRQPMPAANQIDQQPDRIEEGGLRVGEVRLPSQDVRVPEGQLPLRQPPGGTGGRMRGGAGLLR